MNDTYGTFSTEGLTFTSTSVKLELYFTKIKSIIHDIDGTLSSEEDERWIA